MRFPNANQCLWLSASVFFLPLLLHAQETVTDATDVTISAIAETGYFDEQKRYYVDLLEQDYAYLAVRIETKDGQPVQGAVPTFAIDGDSELIPPIELSTGTETDEFGVIEFAVVGGPMGLDKVTVEFGDAKTELFVNVISLKSSGFPTLPTIDGGIPWADLMQAKVEYKEDVLVAEFPQQIKQHAGKIIKLSGFMLPLDPDLKQRRFLLTSNPPSCFYHVPGGPAGAVEVFAAEGIEASWNPIVLEGRFEPQQSSEIGVVYRLHDAHLVSP